jgi:hypothetical protein
MLKNVTIISLLLLAFLGTMCTKSSNYDVIPSQGSVCATAKHHNWVVPEVDMYLKYNTEVSAGWDYKKYDKHIVADTSGKACFDSLPLGSHCIMVLGYDRLFGADIYGYSIIKIEKIADKKAINIAVSE